MGVRVGGEIVYVAVGANLGDREATFASVIRSLDREADLLVLAASPVFETAPVGPLGQGAYLNAALELRSWLAPLDLLRRLQQIEGRLGRDRSPDAPRWGPRTIDLDLLFYGDRCIDLPDLVVPHPRAHERAFVMRPMAELAPGFRHPVMGIPIVEIARGRPDVDDVQLWPRPPGWPGNRKEGGVSGGGG
ncbi:MAG: 2-amino-4-hydroxy-6-hydroxymethyldihydropteridine diphosphokinase [bacterium]|nr:2-amino-4-hydroxy-6-hydroxymethyldihydropteridine diphosphokinase [Deltaproteobacteria bacterium]MCP4905040.1 2-amino-4-hydroxy-6-hydroxymethyldihydropteridine diphosphokinase [bacterium]